MKSFLSGIGVVVGCVIGSATVQAANPHVRVGSKAFTESVILAEALKHLAQDVGTQTEHLAELGGTQVCWKALLAGEIDAYVEYTGTIQQEILDGEPVRNEETMRKVLGLSQVRMSRPLGFNNTYALGLHGGGGRAFGSSHAVGVGRSLRTADLEAAVQR